MKCDHVTEYFPDYLIGNLDENTKSEIQAHLTTCATCKAEVESLSTIWMKLESLPEEQPSESLRARFHTMLEAFKEGQQKAKPTVRWGEIMDGWLIRWWPRQPVFQFGFAVMLLVVGLFVGYRIDPAKRGNQELALLRQEVYSLSKLVTISLLQQRSPSERLRGVSYSYRVEQPDREILSALLYTLNYDPNINVRLAAVDALSLFHDKPLVRQELIESLALQTSPLIQIALINLFVEMEEKQSIEVLNHLKQNEMLNQTVRKRVDWAIQQLQ